MALVATAPPATWRPRCSRRRPGSTCCTSPSAAPPRQRPALVAGQVQVLFDPVIAAMALAQGGQVRPLATSAPRRLPGLPEVPALAETLPGFEMGIWVGFFAPAGTPAAIVARLDAATQAVLALPEVQAEAGGHRRRDPAVAGRGLRRLPADRDRPLDRGGAGGADQRRLRRVGRGMQLPRPQAQRRPLRSMLVMSQVARDRRRRSPPAGGTGSRRATARHSPSPCRGPDRRSGWRNARPPRPPGRAASRPGPRDSAQSRDNSPRASSPLSRSRSPVSRSLPAARRP